MKSGLLHVQEELTGVGSRGERGGKEGGRQSESTERGEGSQQGLMGASHLEKGIRVS